MLRSPAVRGVRAAPTVAVLCVLLPALGWAASALQGADGALRATALRCEARIDPLGVDRSAPRLSWMVESRQRGQVQTAYRVLVARSAEKLARDEGDLWDSGRVESSDTLAIQYAGAPLGAEQACYWKVQVWDRQGRPSAWSEAANWSMGPLASWSAPWIGDDARRSAAPDSAAADKAPPTLVPPAILATDVQVPQRVARATLYATALGLYDVGINGQRVTDDLFNPGWTDYTKRVYYRAYDVTDLLKVGANRVSFTLADGWYSGYVGYGGKRDHYGRKPRVAGHIAVEYEDGTRAVLAETGSSWRATTGPILEADFLMGETYDARLECSSPAADPLDGPRWRPVDVGGAELSPKIQWHPGPPVRAFHEFKPQKITQPTPGAYVFDFGQNFSGVARLRVSGTAGQRIQLRFAERLNPDGTIYTTNLRGARATDTYICRGDGEEVWEPRFTFHGFQFAEITGLTNPPTEDTLTGIAIGSDTPRVGSFECSDPMLNQLASNVYWTQRANFLEVPTDCPQRDERLGWTGDAQVFVGAATLNCDVQAFFDKWLVDLADGQRPDGQFPMVAPVKVAGDDGGPAWADAGVICPWTIYQAYGDRRLLERQYPSMVRFIEFCKQRSTPDLLPPAKYHCFGDWVSINADTPHDVIYTAYFAHSTDLVSRAAAALGREDDARQYRALFERIRAAFNQAYVSADGHVRGETQTAYTMAIVFDLLEPETRKLAGARLVADIEKRGNHLSTGFVGTKDLMFALVQIGRADVAYRLLHSDTFPSWGFTIKNGATSIWERWDGWTPDKGFQDPGMNSFAHYAFGAVYQWMVENIGGIRAAAPGYAKIAIAPLLDDKLTWARTSYQSVRGLIATDWRRTEAGGLELAVTIPANTTAIVELPTAETAKVTESGKPLSQAQGVSDAAVLREDGAPPRVRVTVGSGVYRFVVSGS